MVLLNPSVLEYKNNTVKFKITALAAGSSIAVGLCMKNQMTQKQFKFESIAFLKIRIKPKSWNICSSNKWNLIFK